MPWATSASVGRPPRPDEPGPASGRCFPDRYDRAPPGDQDAEPGGIMLSRSAMSSPILCIAPTQHGDVVSATSITLSIPGRCAGSAPRLTLQRLDILALLVSWRSSAASAEPTICSL